MPNFHKRTQSTIQLLYYAAGLELEVEEINKIKNKKVFLAISGEAGQAKSFVDIFIQLIGKLSLCLSESNEKARGLDQQKAKKVEHVLFWHINFCISLIKQLQISSYILKSGYPFLDDWSAIRMKLKCTLNRICKYIARQKYCGARPACGFFQRWPIIPPTTYFLPCRRVAVTTAGASIRKWLLPRMPGFVYTNHGLDTISPGVGMSRLMAILTQTKSSRRIR